MFGWVEVNICKLNCKDVLVIFVDEGVMVVGVFIENCFCVVLVIVCCEYLVKVCVGGVGICVLVVNIGNVNVGIGELGFVNVCEMCMEFVCFVGIELV